MDSLISDWELLENPWDAVQESSSNPDEDETRPDRYGASSDGNRMTSSADPPRYPRDQPLDSAGFSQLPAQRYEEKEKEHSPANCKTTDPSSSTGAWREDLLLDKSLLSVLSSQREEAVVDATEPDLVNPWRHEGEEWRQYSHYGWTMAMETKCEAWMSTAQEALAQLPDEHKNRIPASAPVAAPTLVSPTTSPAKGSPDRRRENTGAALRPEQLPDRVLNERMSDDPWGAATLVGSPLYEVQFGSPSQWPRSNVFSKPQSAARVTSAVAGPKGPKSVPTSRDEWARAPSPQVPARRPSPIRARTSGVQNDIPPDMIRQARPPRSLLSSRGCAVGMGSSTSFSVTEEGDQSKRRRQRTYVDVLEERYPHRS